MESNLFDNQLTGRFTGERELFLDRVRKTAAAKLADANNQSHETIGNANQLAQAAILDAHKKATNILCQNLQGLYILTDQGVAYADTNGNCGEPLALAGAPQVAVDLASKRVYWSQLVRSPGSSTARAGSPQLQPGQVAIYQQTNFQGQPHILDEWAVIYDNKNAIDFLGPNYQIGSLRLGPNTTATLFEKIMARGFFHQFTEDASDLTKLNLDWAVDQAASFRFCTANQHLMSANLDGSQLTKLAGLPEAAPSVTNTGGVALDDERGLLFWAVPGGQVVRLDLSGGPPEVICVLPGGAISYQLAVDTMSQVVYCGRNYGNCIKVGYDGANEATMVDPSWYLGDFPIPAPAEITEQGWPPAMVATDAANNRLFANNGQQIWRLSDLSDHTWAITSPPPIRNWFFRLYDSAFVCRGLGFDPSTQMLYWIEENGLMRMNVNMNLSDADIMGSVEQVFALQNTKGRILSFTLDTTTEAATQTVMNAHARHQAAQATANQLIQGANDAAATTKRAAQTTLDKAHQTAAEQIAARQDSAAATRQKEQSAAQQKRDAAADVVNKANTAAAAAKVQANSKAQTAINQKQKDADLKKSQAQADLLIARQKLQNT